MNPYHRKSQKSKSKEHPVLSLVFFILFFGILAGGIGALFGFIVVMHSPSEDYFLGLVKYSALIGGFIGAVIAIPINVAYQTGNTADALKISKVLNYMMKVISVSTLSRDIDTRDNYWRD